jgi:hypothetical protein
MKRLFATTCLLAIAGCGQAQSPASNAADAQPFVPVPTNLIATESTTMKPDADGANATQSASKFAFPSCADLRAKGGNADAILAEFETTFPPEIIGEASVEKQSLSPADLTAISTYLACINGLTPNMPPDALDAGLALYASKTHGAAALAALDGVATSTGEAAAFARGFAVQVRESLKGPVE